MNEEFNKDNGSAEKNISNADVRDNNKDKKHVAQNIPGSNKVTGNPVPNATIPQEHHRRPYGPGRRKFTPGSSEFKAHGNEIKIRDGDSFENNLRKFQSQCLKSGVFAEVKKRREFTKPSVRRKKKSEEARKRKFKFK